jgi:hypothetical protein
MNTVIKKCDCCESRVLYVRGDLIHGDFPPSKMIPLADFSKHDLSNLANQIEEHLI